MPALTTPSITAPASGATLTGAFTVTCTASTVVPAPTVAITSPTANAVRFTDATTTVAGTCADTTTVDVYNGATLLGAATVAGTTWSYTSTLPLGILSLRARATGPGGTTDGATVAVYSEWPLFQPADDFNDNSVDATKWTLSQPSGYTLVREQNGRLEFVLRANTTGGQYGTLLPPAGQIASLAGKRLVGRLAQLTTSVSTELVFGAVSDPGNGSNATDLQWNVYAGTLTCYRRNGGAFTQIGTFSAPASLTTHAWLSIRVSADGATVFFEYASDTGSGVRGPWQLAESAAVSSLGFALTSVRTWAVSGTDASVASPGTFALDHVNLLP